MQCPHKGGVLISGVVYTHLYVAGKVCSVLITGVILYISNSGGMQCPGFSCNIQIEK